MRSIMATAMVIVRVDVILALLFVVGVLTPAAGQTYLFDDIKLYDRSTNTTLKVAKPNAIATSQEIIMPSTVGEVGQLLAITNVSSGVITLGWLAEAVGTKPPSDRLTAAQDDAAPSGLSVGVVANRTYSFNGLLLVSRKNAGVTPSDKFEITVSGPSGTSIIDLSVRCLNCPGGTLNGTSYQTTSSASIASATIDPAGSGTDNFSECAISIEGRVVVGATSDRLTVTADNAGLGSNNVILGAQSVFMVTEIKK